MNPAMVVLRKGDNVLVTMPTDLPDDELSEAHKVLADAFPGVNFVVTNGISAVAVMAPDDVNAS